MSAARSPRRVRSKPAAIGMLTMAFFMCAALACGDSAGSEPDATTRDLSTLRDQAAPADDARNGDAAPFDAGERDGALPERCAPCTAMAPWQCDPCLPVQLQEISAAVLDGRIVVAGGFEGTTEAVSTVRRYDPSTGAWDLLAPLPAPRHHLVLVSVGGALYALGGMADLSFRPVADAWVLRAGAVSWESIAALPSPRAAGVGAVVGDRIIVAAGQGNGGSDMAKLQAAAPAFLYDIEADTWSEGAALPNLREHAAGFAHEGKLWVLGGRSIALEPTSEAVDVYDPAVDRWRTGPPMPSPHGGFAAAVLEGVAYVGGGEERDRALTRFEALDLATLSWTTLPNIPTPRHGHAMAAVAGRVFVVGGADRPVFAAVDTVESFRPE